jgi:hypothetical protein
LPFRVRGHKFYFWRAKIVNLMDRELGAQFIPSKLKKLEIKKGNFPPFYLPRPTKFIMGDATDIHQYDAPTASTKDDFSIMVPDSQPGQGPNSGLQTHHVEKKGLFGATKLVPITNEYLIDGICLLAIL